MDGAARLSAARSAIRPGTRADLEALLALETAAFASDRLARGQFRHALASPRMTLLVATEAASVAGYVLLHRRRGARAARITSLAVAAARRGGGIGRALLAAAEADALAEGYGFVRLEVRPRNPARRLYEAAGYAHIARLARYYEDGGTAWRFEKALAV